MRLTLFLVLVLAACGSDGPKADAGDPAAADAAIADAAADGGDSCRALQDEYEVALAQVGKSCETIMDCALVGGQVEPSCDGVPSLGNCSGNAINKLAYRSSRAAEIEAEFNASCAHASCFDVQCIADCAPASDLRCEGHVCIAGSPSCLVPPADAGPGDAAP
jgi:hypothetical protein